jgi:alpha-tubulin suppressor-like RCC1 family protein
LEIPIREFCLWISTDCPRNSEVTGTQYPINILSNGKTVKFIRVFSGYDHLLAESQNGDIYAWSNNSKGQLGLGFISTNESPTKVTFI